MISKLVGTIIAALTAIGKPFLYVFSAVSSAQDIERYLAQSTDHADLERRLKDIHFPTSSRYGGYRP
jgi:hypothetical protein|tara:strand:- start:403 stop:603 length:201 start_codon:yes stop_codon:yes gene_type:complete